MHFALLGSRREIFSRRLTPLSRRFFFSPYKKFFTHHIKNGWCTKKTMFSECAEQYQQYCLLRRVVTHSGITLKKLQVNVKAEQISLLCALTRLITTHPPIDYLRTVLVVLATITITTRSTATPTVYCTVVLLHLQYCSTATAVVLRSTRPQTVTPPLSLLISHTNLNATVVQHKEQPLLPDKK